MQRFFVTPDQVGEDKIRIQGSDVNHMKNVLRMRPGEEVMVSDGNNRQYRCRVEDYPEGEAVLAILEAGLVDTELPSRIYLFQGLPKQEKMELIVQKAVELGVCQVIPVQTRRCVVKLDAKKAAKKVQRWQQIAESAATLAFSEALDIRLIPYELADGMEGTRKILDGIRPGQSVGIFIGPEGGFEKEEVGRAVEAGAMPITLGKRILRTETAGIAVLSILMYRLEKPF